MRVDPPRPGPGRLDPGGRVLGEDTPWWIAAAAAAMGVLLATVAVWAWQGRSAEAEAAPAPRPVTPTSSIPDGTASGRSGGTAPPQTEAVATVPVTAPPIAPAVSTAPGATSPATTAPATTARATTDATVAAAAPVVAAAVVAAAAPACPDPIAIWFPSGSSVPLLDPAALAPIVAWLRERPDGSVIVRGHASAVGDERTNLLLSFERAKRVGATLGELGVAGERIVLRAAGALEPVADNPLDPTNQRVVVAPASSGCGATS